jgi:hypothetical protein
MTGTDLTAVIDAFTATLSKDQAYRHPKAQEAADGVTGVRQMLQGRDAAAVLGPLGFTVTSGVEVDSGRPYALAQSETGPDGERAWAVVLADPSVPVGVVIGCPHPHFDETTEQLGLELWRLVPGALLVIAGAHRDAGANGSVDPRDHPETMFHQIAANLIAKGGLPHVQLHGFADATASGFDVVLSSGATLPDVPFRRVSRGLAAEELAAVEHWLNPISGVGGITNIQGVAANAAGTTFLHVEVSHTARTTAAKRAAVLAGLAAADVGGTSCAS